MTDLRFEAPTTVDDACALLASGGGGARVFAGGTDLLVQMREELIEPTLLVSIKKIKETRQIVFNESVVRIGAAVTGAEIGENDRLKAMWPGVVEAVELIGSRQVQARATIGGNLCNASPAADAVPALMAAGAGVVVAGPDGTRTVPVEEFTTGPGQTVLASGEFAAGLELPARSGKASDAYLRFIPRTEMDIAVVGAGASIELNDDGTCAAARLALGAVAPTARMVDAAHDIMAGKPLNDDVLDQLVRVASDTCSPINDKRGTIEFRTDVAGVLARRTVEIAWRRAEGA